LHWLRREGLLLVILGGLGLAGMPALVYLVGQWLLGDYQPGASMGTFYSDLFAELAVPSPWAWLLVLGPWLAIQLLRALWLPFRPLVRRRIPAPEADGQESAGARI
jgi:hypothetical protein